MITYKKRFVKLPTYYLDDNLKDIFGFLPNYPVGDWPVFPNMSKAIQMFLKHYGKKITIVGDYDVDGTTSVALLSYFFNLINQPYDYIIPDRFVDGYGINKNIVEKIDSDLIITVDNGTSAYEAINRITELGKDLLILDHHAISQEINSPNVVLLNPYGTSFYYLCAAGVVFVFLIELNKILHTKGIVKQNLENLIDYVAVATVCDIVPLIGFNKIFVKKGIEKLNSNPQISYKAIINNNLVDTEFIGFKIGPLINAAGRIDQGCLAVEFLQCKDWNKATHILIDLAYKNKQRKDIEKEILDEALKTVDESKNFIVVSGKWNEGVIGIVASRLKEKFHKPACVISLYDYMGKASIRSYGTLNAAKLIEDLKLLIINGGGHEKAGGFSFKPENLEEIKYFIENYFYKIEPPSISIDLVLCPLVQNKFLESVSKFEPWGANNFEPLCLFPNCQINWTSQYKCSFSSASLKTFAGYFFNLNLDLKKYHLIGYVKKNKFFIIDFVEC